MNHFVEQVLLSGPLLVDRQRIGLFLSGLTAVQTHPRFDDLMARMDDDDFWPDPDDFMARYRPYNVSRGTLQIPVRGSLLNKMSFQIGSFATGYTYIERAFERGMADPAVERIAFVVDSPGGHAAGNFELTDKIFGARNQKPMAAFADTALSGAFSLATAAPLVTVTRSGETGSVGVYTRHADLSGVLKQMGIKLTFIKAGEHKLDGNPFEPLSQEARERMQARIDKIYGEFVSTVARNRSMTESAVRETEALDYDAEESVRVGFADRIGALEEELSAFASEPADDEVEEEDGPMTEKPKDSTFTQADIDAARTEASVEAAKTATEAERNRFAKVMQDENYVGREHLAHTLLTTTELAPEAISAALKAAPKAAPAKDQSGFAAAMDREDNPNVGGGETEQSGGDVVEGIFARAGKGRRPSVAGK